ncbi:MAG: esterase [Deltaproteobacteria bacterium]|jgi:pimeloyl-ACP methyl ester carboxylesterase|nr:esterase [Deltaproteobacteria bacterium]MBW2537072.1 esterase [Deltaproteobacteria bacterium]
MKAAPEGASHDTLGRRALLGGLLGAAVAASCDRADPRSRSTASSAPAAKGPWREWSFSATEHYPHAAHAVVLAKRQSPLLVALHGRGEASRGLVTGARGWRDDYDLGRANRRLANPPLEPKDLLGFVRRERLAALNASLKRHPFRGITVACPFTPALADRSLEGARPFGAFVVKDLVAKARKELELPPQRERVGIDGVSMGGRLALLVGLSHPDVFGAVAALQPAIGAGDVGWLSELAAKAQSSHRTHLRLVTSDDDYFRSAVETLSERLDRDGVKHELLVTPGPHDYVYNRGPGSFEMLLWHDRVLHGLPPP